MRRLAGYPRGFYGCLILVFGGLAASGLMLLPNMLLMKLDIETGMDISGGLRLGTAATHCCAAFLTMLLLGSLLSVHVRAGLHRRQNLLTGVSLLVLLALAMMSAVGVYYFGNEDLSLAASILHASAGLLILITVLAHGIRGNQLFNRRRGRLRRNGRFSSQSAV